MQTLMIKIDTLAHNVVWVDNITRTIDTIWTWIFKFHPNFYQIAYYYDRQLSKQEIDYVRDFFYKKTIFSCFLVEKHPKFGDCTYMALIRTPVPKSYDY